jgi:hypothetical protein
MSSSSLLSYAIMALCSEVTVFQHSWPSTLRAMPTTTEKVTCTSSGAVCKNVTCKPRVLVWMGYLTSWSVPVLLIKSQNCYQKEGQQPSLHLHCKHVSSPRTVHGRILVPSTWPLCHHLHQCMHRLSWKALRYEPPRVCTVHPSSPTGQGQLSLCQRNKQANV